MSALGVNSRALIYVEKRLRMPLHPIGFTLLCGITLTVVALTMFIAQQHRADAPFKLAPTVISATGLMLLFSGFGWFLRRMIISGSWINFERMEGAYHAGLKREAWEILMRRYKIHSEVIQSARCRHFLLEVCSYAMSVGQLNGDQQERVDQLLAAVTAVDGRLAGSSGKTSNAKWGKRIVVAGLIVIFVRAILALWHV